MFKTTFTYKVVDKENKVSNGIIAAWTTRGARRAISHDGTTVLRLMTPRQAEGASGRRFRLRRNFTSVERITFFRNVAAMLSSGIPITRALRIQAEQLKGKPVQQAIERMVRELENGKRLSTAMEFYPKYFSPYLVETVRVGEVSGKLNDTMRRMADDLERSYTLRREIQSKMAYPVVVLIVLIATATVLTGYVLPKLATLFDELGVTPPLPTRIVLGVGTFVAHYPWAIVAGALALVLGVVLAWRSRRGKYVIDTFFLRMPLFGQLVREANIAFFSRALTSMYASGISIVRSVEISRKTLRNSVYTRALENMHPLLLHGTPLSETLRPYPFLFPSQAQHMIEVGEQSGKLGESLQHVTDFYERSVYHRTQTLTSLIEPILMVIVGIAVGGLALAVFLPIYNTLYQVI